MTVRYHSRSGHLCPEYVVLISRSTAWCIDFEEHSLVIAAQNYSSEFSIHSSLRQPAMTLRHLPGCQLRATVTNPLQLKQKTNCPLSFGDFPRAIENGLNEKIWASCPVQFQGRLSLTSRLNRTPRRQRLRAVLSAPVSLVR